MLSSVSSLFARNKTDGNDGLSPNRLSSYDCEASIKLILLGEASVGKTSLAQRFSTDEFSPYQESTIGVSFLEPSLIVESSSDDEDSSDSHHSEANNNNKRRTKITFKIWDTAGQEKYHALASMYYRGAAAAVIVFDISRTSSFLSLQRWVDELQAKGPQGIVLVLCGNKVDLEASGDRQVTREDAESYATKIGALYMETSARDSTNVKELFEMVARKVPSLLNGPAPDVTTSATTIQLGTTRAPARYIANCCGS